MKIYSVYDLATGKLTGQKLGGSDGFVRQNTPAGMAVIAGEHDHLTKAVVGGDLVETDLPIDHERLGGRWVSRAALEAARRDAGARLAIESIEGMSLRAIREALLELLPADSRARARLEEIDSQIAAARTAVRGA